MKPIIEINSLSKKYRYGESQPYYTLRDTLTDFIKSPLKILNSGGGSPILKKDEFWALKDISLNLNQGDVLGIIGPNGSGKSTLLKILSRITFPTKGEALLRGRVGSLLEVGTGFQQELTGRENIYLNGAILGMRRREINKKFDEIVSFSGVEKFLDTPVKHYSSGMYMRLAFSVAAHLDSEILIVDEVLAVGDSEFQNKCLGKMNEIVKSEGRTIIFVSHNLDAIKKLCNRCMLLNKGSNVYEGTVEKTISKYSDLQTKIDLRQNLGGNNLNHRGSGTVAFNDIEIADEDDKERNVFYPNDTVKFKISYSVSKNIDGLNLIIGLYSTSAGGLMFTDIRQRIKSGNVKKGTKGKAAVEVKLDRVRPSEYYLEFWLGDDAAVSQNNPVNYDLVQNMTKPLIIEPKDEKDKNLTGYFSLPSKIFVKE